MSTTPMFWLSTWIQCWCQNKESSAVYSCLQNPWLQVWYWLTRHRCVQLINTVSGGRQAPVRRPMLNIHEVPCPWSKIKTDSQLYTYMYLECYSPSLIKQVERGIVMFNCWALRHCDHVFDQVMTSTIISDNVADVRVRTPTMSSCIQHNNDFEISFSTYH